MLDLDAKTQKALANGNVKMESVSTLHKMPAEKRAEVIAKSDGSGPSIAKAARESGVAAPHTDADFKGWMRETSKKVPARGVAMLQAILDWRAGKIGTGELTEMYIDLVGGKK